MLVDPHTEIAVRPGNAMKRPLDQPDIFSGAPCEQRQLLVNRLLTELPNSANARRSFAIDSSGNLLLMTP
jgi:hypothetical protein